VSGRGRAALSALGLLLIAGSLTAALWHWRHLLPHATASRLYVTDPVRDKLLVFDLDTGKVRKVLELGRLPHQVLTGKHERLYVVESGSQSVSVIDTRTDTVVAQRPVGQVPNLLAHRAVGETAVREARSCKACHHAQILGNLPGSLTLSRDQRSLWVTELRTRRLSRLDAATLQTGDQLGLLGGDTTPTQVLVHPRSGELFVASRSYRGDTPGVGGVGDTGLRISLDPEHAGSMGTSNVMAFDTNMEAVKGRVELPFAGAHGGVFSPDGSELYLACRGADRVAVLSTSPLRLLRSYRVPPGPTAVALIDDETLAVACLNTAPGSVELLERRTGRPVGHVTVPANPAALAWDAASRRLFVACTGGACVAEVDVDARRVVREHPVGGQPGGLAVVAAPRQ
jgi:YVTN family beta-propeller protein